MKFHSAYNLPEEKAFSPSGEEEEITYGYEIDKKGLKNLVETGKTNVYEKIQQYAEETKIENVIQRVLAGDESVMRPDAIYADISKHPKSMLEAMEQIHGLEKTYSELSEEIKQKYPTIESWVQSAGTEEWMKLNGYIKEQPQMQEVKEKLVTESTLIAEQVKEAIPNE